MAAARASRGPDGRCTDSRGDRPGRPPTAAVTVASMGFIGTDAVARTDRRPCSGPASLKRWTRQRSWASSASPGRYLVPITGHYGTLARARPRAPRPGPRGPGVAGAPTAAATTRATIAHRACRLNRCRLWDGRSSGSPSGRALTAASGCRRRIRLGIQDDHARSSGTSSCPLPCVRASRSRWGIGNHTRGTA